MFVALAGLAGTQAASRELVELQLRGHYYSAPATVFVNVVIEPAAKNHRLVVEADSERFFHSSDIEPMGERDRRIHTVLFKNLPEGAYTLRAGLHSKSELLGRSEALTVTGGGGR